MAGASTTLHETPESLSQDAVDQHRALVSLQEELEAVDWYRQRAEAAGDEQERAILLHNMREEIEHACMLLEWLRRRNPDFDAQLRTYLFTEGDITEAEEAETGGGPPVPAPAAQEERHPSERLSVGSLKENK